MTYKTTREAINALVEVEELFLLRPMLPGEAPKRFVFVSKEVRHLLMLVSLGQGREAWMAAKARAMLDAFVVGVHVTVGWDPRHKHRSATMARVDPLTDAVWDFRCTDPRPGVRIFGRFAERDVFVCLTWADRRALDFDAQALRCRDVWQTLFRGVPPHDGIKLSDHISERASIV